MSEYIAYKHLLNEANGPASRITDGKSDKRLDSKPPLPVTELPASKVQSGIGSTVNGGTPIVRNTAHNLGITTTKGMLAKSKQNEIVDDNRATPEHGGRLVR